MKRFDSTLICSIRQNVFSAILSYHSHTRTHTHPHTHTHTPALPDQGRPDAGFAIPFLGSRIVCLDETSDQSVFDADNWALACHNCARIKCLSANDETVRVQGHIADCRTDSTSDGGSIPRRMSKIASSNDNTTGIQGSGMHADHDVKSMQVEYFQPTLMCTRTHPHTHTHHMRLHTHTHTHTHTRTHHMRLHTHTHTHTHRPKS